MRINQNITALNTYRQLSLNTTASAKATEKLSSGIRINRAGDDAAGLAISEKMRGQIRGLKQASRNAQDGISLIQTAEGALNETHAILQRMRELAVQSANDTNVAVDRQALQDEINELAAEITRIADTTEFNTQNLLGGNFLGTFHIGANEGQNIALAINRMDAEALRVVGGEAGLQIGSLTTAASGAEADDGNFDDLFAAANGGQYTVVRLAEDRVWANGGTQHTFSYGLQGTDGKYYGFITSDGNRVVLAADGGESDIATEVQLNDTVELQVTFGTGYSVTSGTVTINRGADDSSLGYTATADSATAIYGDNPGRLLAGTYTVVNQNHVLVGAGHYGLVDSNGDLKAYSIGGTAWTTLAGEALFSHNLAGAAGERFVVSDGKGIDISSQSAASAAITIINSAIETVSAERSKLGAYQNRLEHSIKNLDASAENLQSAESRVRDLDMAQEMMNYTKQNILQQAATALLAQANQAPQAVLQLLR
ncbi:MAG: flagellin [Syntrophomonadaceae bacterium]|nr:flagellin [Syntrophomonadaceae bacterium]